MGIYDCKLCKDCFTDEKNIEIKNSFNPNNSYNDRQTKLEAQKNNNIDNMEMNSEQDKEKNESNAAPDANKNNIIIDNNIEIKDNENMTPQTNPNFLNNNYPNNKEVKGNLPYPMDDSKDEDENEKNDDYIIIKEDENYNNN